MAPASFAAPMVTRAGPSADGSTPWAHAPRSETKAESARPRRPGTKLLPKDMGQMVTLTTAEINPFRSAALRRWGYLISTMGGSEMCFRFKPPG